MASLCWQQQAASIPTPPYLLSSKFKASCLSLLYQGLPLAIGQTFFSEALMLTSNHGVTTMVGFVSVILGYLVKIFRYKEEVNFFCLSGSILIMLGVARIAFKH